VERLGKEEKVEKVEKEEKAGRVEKEERVPALGYRRGDIGRCPRPVCTYSVSIFSS